MVSLQKTRLAKLRGVLGPAGSESRFPKLVGLSGSWVKKCSSGHLPMTARAASAIHDATGVCLLWLMGESDSAVPVEADGRTAFTLESFTRWKMETSPDEGDYPRLYNPISLRLILRVLANVAGGKKQTSASCALFEFAQKMKTDFGAAESFGDYGREMFRTLARLDEISQPPDTRPLAMQIIKGSKSSKPTRQKKEPSRKSKRTASH
jgi:hypothetical protein